MALLIKTSGQVEFVRPGNGTDFSLEEMQSLVGGFVEILQIKNERRGNDRKYILLAHEESKLVNEPEINPIASKIANLFPGDYVAGDVVLCKDCEVL